MMKNIKRLIAVVMALMLVITATVAVTSAESKGDIIRAYVRADGTRVMVDMANVTFTTSVELKLYCGTELLTTATLNTAEVGAGTYGEFTGSICMSDTSGTWPNTAWFPLDGKVPDKIELVVDGAVADTWNGIYNSKSLIEIYEVISEAEWAALDSTLAAEPTVRVGDDAYYVTLAEAVAAAKDGDTVTILAAGTYSVPTGKSITITGAVDGVVFDNIGARNMGGANVTFNNVTFDYYPNVNYTGLQHSGNLVYNNCTFNGQVFLYGASETFNTCTFNQNSADAYNVWTYGADVTTFNGCTFNSVGKSLLIYSDQPGENNVVNVNDCDFIASAPVEGKAAIEMDSSLMNPQNGKESSIVLNIDGETTTTGFAAGNVSGNDLWNNKKGNKGVNNDITVIVDGETVLEPVFTAKIGETKYDTLQKAIDAAVNGDTIVLLSDCEEDVTVKQVEGVNVVIDGNGKNFSGIVYIHGSARYQGEETLTIQNVNFVTSEKDHDFISANSTASAERYAHNVTVTGCSFTATGDAVGTAVAFRFRQSYDIAVKNCTANGLHSVMWATGGDGISIDTLTATNCLNGVSFGTTNNVTVNNVNLTVTGYGIRADGSGAYNATVSNAVITADQPIVIRKTTGNYTLTLGEGNRLTSTGESGYTVIVTNGDDDEALQKPIGDYTVTGNGVSIEKIYPAGVGDIVRAYLKADGSRIMVDMADVTFYRSVELKLYSGSELLSTATLNAEEYPYGAFAELTGSIYITDIGGTWPNTPWTPHDIVFPDKIELVVDGAVADVWEGIYNSNYEVLTAEEWAELTITSECEYGMCWNNYYHWRECDTCGDIIQQGTHGWMEAGVIKQATETETGLFRYVCTCGGYKDVTIPVLGHEHAADAEWKYDEDAHWNECECGEHINEAVHTWNDGVETEDAMVYTCTVCGQTKTGELPAHVHTAGSEYKYNDTHHWNECECGEVMNESTHLWVTDKVENGTIYSKCVFCDATVETPEQTDSYDDESVSYLLPALAIGFITVAFAAVAAKRKFN